MRGDIFKNRKGHNQVGVKRNQSESDLKKREHKMEKERLTEDNCDYERRWIMQ